MVVGYDALSNAVVKLRKAFGDDPKNPEIIETIPKVGYRLISEVSHAAPEDESSPSATRPQRKLAAILYADVAEYSRLTEADEEGTHQILSTYVRPTWMSVGCRGGQEHLTPYSSQCGIARRR